MYKIFFKYFHYNREIYVDCDEFVSFIEDLKRKVPLREERKKFFTFYYIDLVDNDSYLVACKNNFC